MEHRLPEFVKRLLVILVCLGPWSPVAGQERGVLTGRVVDDNNRPLRGAIVYLLTSPGLGAVSDASGSFALQIPAGEHVVRAQLIGYEISVHFLTLAHADSVEIEFRLPGQAVQFGGVDQPLAPVYLQTAAWPLIEAVLSDSATESIIRTEFTEYRRSPIRAWIPWFSGEWAVEIAGRRVELTSVCDGCSAENSMTLEGGLLYRARIPHLRLGITAPGVRTPIVTFCLAAALPGDRLMPNCAGGRGSVRITYAQSPDGHWIRIPPN